MKESTTYYTDLIVRFLSGEADAVEMRDLASWLKSSSEHQELFRQMAAAWSLVDQAAVESLIDTDSEFQALSRVTFKAPVVTMPRRTVKQVFLQRWVAVAAIFLAVVVSAIVWVQYSAGPSMITVVADGSRRPVTLPDSTVVVLNTGSITYPEKFLGGLRQVELKGEAWFEVAHDSIHRFIVKSGDLRVEVLGTKFYMESSNLGLSATVVLSEGSVALYRASVPAEQLLLEPGQRARITDGQMEKSDQSDPNYLAWKTGRITFVNQPLSEVAAVLSKVFNRNVVLDNSAMTSCRLTADFDNMPVDSILQVVSTTLDLKVSHHGQTIVLSGKGCR